MSSGLSPKDWMTLTTVQRVELCRELAEKALKSMDAVTSPDQRANLLEISDAWINLARTLEHDEGNAD